MIDGSKGFMKDGPKNRLRERDIHLRVRGSDMGSLLVDTEEALFL